MEAEIQRAWAEHGDQPEAVAARLPTLVTQVRSAGEAAAFTRFVVHFVGEERQDWSQAAALCGQAVGAAPQEPALAPAEADLAVARLLSGDLDGGLAAEARAAALDAPHALAHVARARLGVATARLARGPEAHELLGAALDLAALVDHRSPVDRALAIAMNNLASALLERPREAAQDALMVRAATLSQSFWERAGTWVNAERAAYLLALVSRAIGLADDARLHAASGLALIAANGDEPVDVAFLSLVEAAACRDLGMSEASATSLSRADTIAAGFQESWLQTWFAEERAKAFPAP